MKRDVARLLLSSDIMNARYQTLTNPKGRTTRAAVTYHAHDWNTGGTACGRSFESLRAQGFNTHQTGVSADHCDVNCPICRAVLGLSYCRAEYIKAAYSLQCVEGVWGACLHTRWSHREIWGATRALVVAEARCEWGHFNWSDEAQAFGEIFR